MNEADELRATCPILLWDIIEMQLQQEGHADYFKKVVGPYVIQYSSQLREEYLRTYKGYIDEAAGIKRKMK